MYDPVSYHRYHPVAQRLHALLREAPLGQIQSAAISFSLVDLKSWWLGLWQPATTHGRSSAAETEENLVAMHKMLDRWCYCADLAALVADAAGIKLDTVSTAFVSNSQVSASLQYHVPTEGHPGTKHDRIVPVYLSASKSTMELPHWNVAVSCAQGNITVSNIGFPFLGHSVSVGAAKEYHYGNGGTTFEYQLQYFVACIKGAAMPANEDSQRTALLTDKINSAAHVPHTSTVSWTPHI